MPQDWLRSDCEKYLSLVYTTNNAATIKQALHVAAICFQTFTVLPGLTIPRHGKELEREAACLAKTPWGFPGS